MENRGKARSDITGLLIAVNAAGPCDKWPCGNKMLTAQLEAAEKAGKIRFDDSRRVWVRK